MTDNQDNPNTTTPAVTPDSPTPATTATTAVSQHRGGHGVAWLGLLAALAAGGGGGYLWYQLNQDRAGLDQRLQAKLQEVVQQRDADLKGLREQLAAQQRTADDLLGKATALQGQNDTQSKEDQNLRGSVNNLQAEIKGLQGDITTLKGEVEIHKGGVEIQKADTQNLIAHVRTLQTDIKNLQGHHEDVQTGLTAVQSNHQINKSAVQALQQDVQALTGNLQALKEQFGGSQDERRKALAELDNRIQNLQLAQRNLLTTLDNVKTVVAQGGDVNAFPLAEVGYLLRIADYKLRLHRDVSGSLEALTIAEQRLAGVNEAAFSGVQQMIKENITSLHGVSSPDRSALAQKLVDMEGQVDGLPLQGQGAMAGLKEKVKPRPASGASPEEGPGWWEQAGTVALGHLKDIVVIRRERSNAAPLIAIDEEYFLRQNLRMELEAMRIALLTNDVNSYQVSDNTARKWLETYFDAQNPQVAALMNELDALKAIKLNPYLPDLSSTLRAFQEVMERRQPVRSVSTAEGRS
jgi:uroporphyrin-3 C-methyltransferase